MSAAAASHPARGRPAAGQAEQITRRIVDAAWRVVLDGGPEQFALDRVAQAAHASKQTIYARFSGKRELLQAVLAARIGLIYGEFRLAAGAGALEAVIADVTRRSVNALGAPDSLMLDRLADWIDASLEGNPTRAAIYAEFHHLLCHYLRGHARSVAAAASGDRRRGDAVARQPDRPRPRRAARRGGPGAMVAPVCAVFSARGGDVIGGWGGRHRVTGPSPWSYMLKHRLIGKKVTHCVFQRNNLGARLAARLFRLRGAGEPTISKSGTFEAWQKVAM